MRNYETWREEDEVTETKKRKRETEEMGDAMKALENKASDSKREMEINAVLSEMQSMKSRRACVSVDSMLEVLKRQEKEKKELEEEEDEALVKSIFRNSKQDCVVKRIHDDDLEWKKISLMTSLNKKENPGGKLAHGEANRVVFKPSTSGYRISVVKKSSFVGSNSKK
ncbi:coiled-coil domain-containing protein 94-like [Fagus crenata]